LSDSEAVLEADRLLKSGRVQNDFLSDLVRKAPSGLSQKQLLWLRFLVAEATGAAPGCEIDLVRIVAMLHLAKNAGELRRPKLRILTRTGRELSTNLATDRSSRPGSVAVVENGGFLGWIPKNGRVSSTTFDPEVVEALLAVCEDPLGAATLYGRRTGSCCFCGKELTHKNSIALGYGPICAEKWGVFHDYARGAVVWADDHAKPSEIVEAAEAQRRSVLDAGY
jgi:hypothetical protein